MLEIKNITKVYDMGETKVDALRGVSLDFAKSEFVSILGASGCGKTTLLNIIGGLDKYTSGDIIVDGTSTKDFKDSDWDTYRNHKIGFVFQNYNLIQHLSVLENVEIALTLSGVSKAVRRELSLEALKKVGLLEQVKKMPNQLSGGQMQRVAIARAIVNNPTIILADEPTGALDSKTSKQIMEILKEISNERLIVMVTHNAKIAKEYSTRIIKLVDGKVRSDRAVKRKNESEENLKNLENFENIAKNEQKNAKNQQNNQDFLDFENNLASNKQSNTVAKKAKNKSSLSFWTALFLSLKNLLTKKGRTFLTSFAGSIGIIGVALVLSISNGFSLYINNMQQDTLSGYPISVATATIDYSQFTYSNTSGSNQEKFDDAITITGGANEYIRYGHYNCINENFVNTVKEFERTEFTNKPDSNFALIEYNYFAPTKFLIKNDSGKISLLESKNSISLLTNSTSNLFYPQLSNESFILQSYDVVYTSPNYVANDKYGLTLVLNKGNRMSYMLLEQLGIKSQIDLSTSKYKPVSFEDICEKVDVQLLFNDDYYVYDEVNDKFDTIDLSDSALETLFNSNTLQSLKITRIIAPKDDSNTGLLSTGVMYSYALHQEYLENCKTSEVAQKQSERKLAQNGTGEYTFYIPLTVDISEMQNILAGFENMTSSTVIETFLRYFFKTEITLEEAYQMGVQQIGVSTIPQSIVFYPKNFDAKGQVTTMINKYNESVESVYKIIVSDNSEFLINTLGSIINIISIVLVAFASISLVVSSIMIGIITYVSVIERTKEIGILRSLGARKQDISRIFNAETIIIGAFAGFIGVAVTYIFCPIINLIVGNFASVGTIAQFNPMHALVLILISMALTLISGSIPSKIASKKDPVECLRTE